MSSSIRSVVRRRRYDSIVAVLGLSLVPGIIAALAQDNSGIDATIYALHAQKPPSSFCLTPCVVPPSSVLALTPDNALLVLIPQRAGRWVLKRLTGWNTRAPREQTLTLAGEPTDQWPRADLTMTPDGGHLIARFNSYHRAPAAVEAVVIVVQPSYISPRFQTRND